MFYRFRDVVCYLSKVAIFSYPSCIYSAPVRVTSLEFHQMFGFRKRITVIYSTLFTISGTEKNNNRKIHMHTHTKHLTVIHKRTQYYINMPKYLYHYIDN